jgi:hypothetical protein
MSSEKTRAIMMAQLKKPKLSRRSRLQLEELRHTENLSGIEKGDVVEEAIAFYRYPVRKKLLIDVANLRDVSASDWFWPKWSKASIRWAEPESLLELRDDLRGIWLTRDLELVQQTLNQWLIQNAVIQLTEEGNATDLLLFYCSPLALKLVPNETSLVANLIQGIFDNWNHFKKCTNPACASPYFIAKRSDQTVCDSGICKNEKQREHKRNWWNENRAKKSQKEAVGKAAKKGSKKNVTRKAR